MAIAMVITPTSRIFVGRIELITSETKRAVEQAIAKGDRSMIDRYGRFLDPILKRISSESPSRQILIEEFRQSIQGSIGPGNAQYQQAMGDFQRATALDPSNINARLYLATSYMTMYVPGVDAADNRAYAEQARTEFQHVLEQNPSDRTALASLASLSYQEAQGLQNREEKVHKLDESIDWNRKLLAVDPQNKEAYYTLGVIAWVKWYPAYSEARARLGMRPEDPGPFRDGDVRQQLNQQFGQSLSEGIANLERALLIDPQYDDAMAYENLLIRERADLRDTESEYRQDIATADEWLHKAVQTKKVKAMKGISGMPSVAAPPPPPPPPTGAGGSSQRIRVDSNVQQSNLIYKVDPVYPPLAKQARIQGTVRFTAIIGKDGNMRNLQLVSGHPLLVAAAQEAVKQWTYKPTLLNGQPVEVVTEIDVPFSLTP